MKSYRTFHTIKGVSSHPDGGKVFYTDLHPIQNYVDHTSVADLNKSMSNPTKKSMTTMHDDIIKTAMDQRNNLIKNTQDKNMLDMAFSKKHNIFYVHEAKLNQLGYVTNDWKQDKTVVIRDKQNNDTSKHNHPLNMIAEQSRAINNLMDAQRNASEEAIITTLKRTRQKWK